LANVKSSNRRAEGVLLEPVNVLKSRKSLGVPEK